MPRVKIKVQNIRDPRKSNLLELLSRNDIFITKLISLSNGYVVVTNNETDQDKILKTETKKEHKQERIPVYCPTRT